MQKQQKPSNEKNTERERAFNNPDADEVLIKDSII